MLIIKEEIKKKFKEEPDYNKIISHLLKKDNKTNLLNKKDLSFAVFIDYADDDILEEISKLLDSLNLTIYGDGSNRATKLSHTPFIGIEEGDVLVFGKNKRFDIELSTPERTLYTNIGNTEPAYNLVGDFHKVIKAIKQFASAKKKLSKKYPQNTNSRTLNEMVCFEDCKCNKHKQTNKKKVNVTVSSNWIRIGNEYIRKNAADTVKITDKNFVTTIPGCYYM